MNNTEILDVAAVVIQRLKDNGVTAVMCGGGARDLFYGRDIKDIDLFVIGGFGSESSTWSAVYYGIPEVRTCSRRYGADYGGGTKNNSDPRLAYVISFEFAGVKFDLIEYAAKPATPEAQVRLFDCELSQAWWSPDTCCGCTDEFMQIMDGTREVHMLTLCNDIEGRREYLRSKFPQLKFSLEVL